MDFKKKIFDVDKAREGFREAAETYKDEKQKVHDERKEKAVKYDSDLLKVVEVPMAFTKDSWDQVNAYLEQGYTIKAVLEREFWKTSQIILEKVR